MTYLKSWVLSRAYYDGTGGVGKSKLQEHFPHEPGPDQFYDHVTGVRHPMGRHPDTGDPLWVKEYDRYTQQIITPGVMSLSDRITPEQDSVPSVCVTEAIVYNFDVAQAIHAHAQHLVLAFETIDGSEPPIEGWGKEDGFTASQWTKYRNALVALGMPAETIDTWRDNHPNATRRDFYMALRGFINQQES